MNKQDLTSLLAAVQQGTLSVEEAVNRLSQIPFMDLGFAKVDTHRELRTGYPEVIFCPGKTTEQIRGIMETMTEKKINVLASRATESLFRELQPVFPGLEFHAAARILFIANADIPASRGKIAVATGGTADLPVAEEAAVTAEKLGIPVERVYDVGVAGIHRLLSCRSQLEDANVVIAIAGMEGALASVIGGMTDKPVIAVPTSVGYGANFGGLAALLAMLNSCATGIGVVNIDNGFGAACLAAKIVRQMEKFKSAGT